jgi:UDP-N-acetylmuramoyl-tripeptide--D-alanyl-D-alanine ligase
MKWTLADAARACSAVPHGDTAVTGVVTDSRDAAPGALFVALMGEHADGHDFVADAAHRGAAAVCARGRLPQDVAGFEVDDTLDALRQLGEARRAELATPVVAITGSSGKTTTKDFLAATLGTGAHAAPRSFNNEIGVPLTILGCPDDATALVVEVGSRGRGHIAKLADVVQPAVAVITNIGRAHLETFGTVEDVLVAKWELVEALGPDGVAVLPAGDPRLTGRRNGPMITFGEEPDADVRIAGTEMDRRGLTTFRLEHRGESAVVALGVPGLHQPLNAAAAVAASVALGRPFIDAAARLPDASVSQWRMELLTAPVAGGSITIVNDAYNANPDSVETALRTVAAMPGRHVAVLGKMHELGVEEAQLHREAGALAAGLDFEVVVVGEDPGIADGAGPAALRLATPAEAIEHLRGSLSAGDVVLVKASRAAGLESVALGFEEVTA